jgi:hypothetical protein
VAIANTGRFWKILVIPVLQILEDSGNTGYTSIADTGKSGMKLRNVLLYWGFFNTDLPNLAFYVCIPLLLSPGLPIPCLLTGNSSILHPAILVILVL